MSSIGVGLIGAGSFGAQHAMALALAGGFHLVGACRESPQGLEDFIARHGGRAYSGTADLLADPAVDAVVIATPHDRHEEAAVAAARAGKAILLEKPLAPTLEACDRIAAAAKAASVPLMIGHVQRFAAPLVAAKAALDAGRLGAVRFGMSAMVKLWMEANRQPWHMRNASGGGMLMTAGIHALDRLLWLVGSPVHSVTAVAQAAFHDQESDDSALLLLRFASGAAATVASIAYRDGAPFGGTELVCENGVMLIDPGGAVRIGKGAAWTALDVPESSNTMFDALVSEWRAFGRLIREGGPNPVDAASARATIACILAALESSKLCREVVLAP
ncbi:Gfo/Idh/MocA family oxidoreductase [uncultured Alsobacter sp.]|uniref:Gfo/Idh/MocA family protein n=1 Tax=uncultured Alsobacter sp. TaxID=1748258 RepID=UPI0025E3A64C|nr:Gfo/Idh/MocA family oxidoreductase [uncultured Alsobacter sp.]